MLHQASEGADPASAPPAYPRGLFREEPRFVSRRRDRRLAFHAAVELSGPAEASGTTLDRSRGGLCVALDQEVERGQCFRVVLRTPEDEVVRGYAQVVWCGVAGYDYVAGLAYVD